VLPAERMKNENEKEITYFITFDHSNVLALTSYCNKIHNEIYAKSK
jgi:hypothetical protein